MPGDKTGNGEETVSMTYAELAKALGIEVSSAQRRVVRSGWKRVPGNDGRARIAVPLSALPDVSPGGQGGTPPSPQPVPGIAGGDVSPDMGETAGTIIQKLLDRLEAADASLEAERTRWGEDRAKWDAARDAWDVERDELTRERAALREELARREGELAGLREALARPVPAPLRDVLERLRAWMEAKGKRR